MKQCIEYSVTCDTSTMLFLLYFHENLWKPKNTNMFSQRQICNWCSVYACITSLPITEMYFMMAEVFYSSIQHNCRKCEWYIGLMECKQIVEKLWVVRLATDFPVVVVVDKYIQSSFCCILWHFSFVRENLK